MKEAKIKEPIFDLNEDKKVIGMIKKINPKINCKKDLPVSKVKIIIDTTTRAAITPMKISLKLFFSIISPPLI